MIILVAYSYYIGVYRGIAITNPDEFERLSMRALEYIDGQTLGRASQHLNLHEVKKACCALAEVMAEEKEHEGKKSESVGDWSASYISSEESNDHKSEIISQYLFPTGLLYMGVG